MPLAARRGAGRLVVAALLALFMAPAAADSTAEGPAAWAAYDPRSNRILDHTIWTRFLERYVPPSGGAGSRFPYGQVSGEDRARVGMYINAMERVAVSQLARSEQAAYWINLYNALVVKLVLDWYPLPSIKEIDISPRLFYKGPFAAPLLSIEGRRVSLEDIEQRILRPLWRDPRMLYALHTSAASGPELAAEAYSGLNLDAQLEEAARAYVNNPRGVRVSDGKLYVSSLFIWCRDDFGGTDAAIIEHLQRYAAPPLAAQLRGIRRIKDDDYDWGLDAMR